MKPSQKRKSELFVYNRTLAKKNLKSNNSFSFSLISEAYSSQLYVFDIKKVLYHIKAISGKIFEPDITTVLVASRMSLRSKPSADRISDIYVELKKRLKNRCPDYYIQYAACILSEYTNMEAARIAYLAAKQMESIRANRSEAMYCDNDFIIACLLALYNHRHRDRISDDIAECIEELKSRGISLGTAKHVARILAFGNGVASARCDRFIRLAELLKERDANIGTGKEMSAVAFAALIDVPDETLADSIAEINNYLAHNKYLDAKVNGSKRVMYSVLIACTDIMEDIDEPSYKLIKEATLANILSLEIAHVGGTYYYLIQV